MLVVTKLARTRILATGCVLALSFGAAQAANSQSTPPVAAVPAATSEGGATAGDPTAAGTAGTEAPGLSTRVAMRDLDIPWDIAVLPSGSWLVTERDRQRITLRLPDGGRRVLVDNPPGFWASGETGLMSIVADPRVGRNDRFYTCAGFMAGQEPQIRVYAWRLNAARTAAHRVTPLLTGIDINGGRHGGCRLRFDPAGTLYVGTGDSAVGTNPQDLTSLNGKILRLDRFSGEPSPANPWAQAKNRNKRYIFNYGHRNVQGLAWRPGDQMWTVEHGTDRDDEVNRAIRGGNYGWDPVPGYDESTPMTDYSLPGRQIGARWRSGFPTIATSGAVWVRGEQWGAYQGALAVCALGGERLLFMKFGADNTLRWVRTPPALDGDFGRLRTVVQDAQGALLVTTGNGGGNDVIVEVAPR